MAGARDEHGPATTGRDVPVALAWGLFAKVIVSGMAIFSNVLIVRGLGDEAYGVYSIFLNVARFVALAIGLGLAQAILQFLPELRVTGNPRGIRQLLVRALIYPLGAWLVALGAMWPLRGWLSRIYAIDLEQILLLGCALLLAEILFGLASHVYMSVRAMRPLTVVQALTKALLIVALLERGGSMTLEEVAARFDEALDRIEELGDILHREIQVQDVTEEFQPKSG